MTAFGFAMLAFVVFFATLEKQGGLKLNGDAHAALGLVLVLAYMLMTYGLTSFFWAVLP